MDIEVLILNVYLKLVAPWDQDGLRVRGLLHLPHASQAAGKIGTDKGAPKG